MKQNTIRCSFLHARVHPYKEYNMNENWIQGLLVQAGLKGIATEAVSHGITLIIILCLAALITLIVRKTLLAAVIKMLSGNKHSWNSAFLKYRFFNKVSLFATVTVISFALDISLPQESTIYLLTKRLTMASFVLVAVFSLSALLSSLNDIKGLVSRDRRQLLRSYTDVGIILTYIFGIIFIISIFTGKSPWGIISVLGGLTAVTLLIFKDSILGFIASLHLSTMDLVRLGDWIEMPQYGADGDVIEISIHSVKVQNWDKTITSIPTYSLVGSSFKNWRGMTDSGGRRIKRALNIDIQSIRFCDQELFATLSEVQLLKEYLENKQQEISEFNQEKQTPNHLSGSSQSPLNGRQQTNIGIFRAYIVAYLKENPLLHQDMTFLVRHLAPSGQGLPIEIYVFSKRQAWVEYEAIQADIFDHLLAAAPEFGLRIFQEPTGYDMRQIGTTRQTIEKNE